METYTGKKFYPLSPIVEDIDIADIAHALSLQCRYNGHVSRFYSVAEHCLHLSYAVGDDPELAMWALLHDSTEAYVGDMIRPLKVSMPEYCEVEDNVMAAIAIRFSLDGATLPAQVKDVDTRILLDEKKALMTRGHNKWIVDDLEPLGCTIYAYGPEEAERRYLDRFSELQALR